MIVRIYKYEYCFLLIKKFKLSEKNHIDRRILKCDYIRYRPSEISTINTDNSQIYINKPREDSLISLLKILLI